MGATGSIRRDSVQAEARPPNPTRVRTNWARIPRCTTRLLQSSPHLHASPHSMTISAAELPSPRCCRGTCSRPFGEYMAECRTRPLVPPRRNPATGFPSRSRGFCGMGSTTEELSAGVACGAAKHQQRSHRRQQAPLSRTAPERSEGEINLSRARLAFVLGVKLLEVLAAALLRAVAVELEGPTGGQARARLRRRALRSDGSGALHDGPHVHGRADPGEALHAHELEFAAGRRALPSSSAGDEGARGAALSNPLAHPRTAAGSGCGGTPCNTLCAAAQRADAPGFSQSSVDVGPPRPHGDSNGFPVFWGARLRMR